MAERRMLSSKIICSDAFTEMPFSAQALYLQLALEADDDGFLNNARRIQRTIEASEADLITLLERRFILGFDKGVVCIKHWRTHNQIRKDRYTPTQYQEEFHMLDIKADGAYTEKPGCNLGTHLAPTWQPNGAEAATQVRLGKVSIGKVNINSASSDSGESEQKVHKPSLADVNAFFETVWAIYPVKKGKAQVSESKRKALFEIGLDKLRKAIERYLEELKKDPWRKPQNGSTFFNSGYVDYLDENFVPDKVPDKQYTRTETKPNWMAHSMQLGAAELAAINRALEEDPDVQAEAEQMRQRMQEKYGKGPAGSQTT